MSLTYQVLRGADVAPTLETLARLRIAVFRDWPYLYDGDLAYEANYLVAYADNPRAVVVTAHDQGRIVGAATGMPMRDHADDFAAALAIAGIAADDAFYCAESVLLPAFRGHGAGHVFFDRREDQAHALGLRYCVFCAVMRPADHPARPATYRALDGFWRKRGYHPAKGAIAHFDWRDVGAAQSTRKPLQLWIKDFTE